MSTGASQIADAWVLGTAGATVYPADGQGGSVLAPGDSELGGSNPAKSMYIVSVRFITIHIANAVQVVDRLGNVVPGLEVTPSAANYPGQVVEFGVQFDDDTDATVGLKCNGTNVAVLNYRRVV